MKQESKKLTIKWDKRDKCLGGAYPSGTGTRRDLHYLFGFVFSAEFQKEMKERGYDLKTLKFEISAKQVLLGRRAANYQSGNGLHSGRNARSLKTDVPAKGDCQPQNRTG